VRRVRAEVWVDDLPDVLRPGDLALLDGDERARADRFVRAVSRVQFVGAHAALRRRLGDLLGADPGSLRFTPAPCVRCGGPHGKPELAGDQAGLMHFSLSHSGRMVAVAAAGAPVGVDVEAVRPLAAGDLAARFFSDDERRLVGDAADAPAAFVRLWTRKEALLKATGEGITGGLASAPGMPAPGAGPALPLRVVRAGRAWIVRDVDTPPGYAAAVAVADAGEGDGGQVTRPPAPR
jgi:4'-phosphopantetheinyl transferase